MKFCVSSFLNVALCVYKFMSLFLKGTHYSKEHVVQLPSLVPLIATLWAAAHQASLPFTIFWSLLKLMSIELVMPSSHLILCHHLLLLPSIFPSISVFFNELVLCNRLPKYWSFSFSISPSNEYSGSISFRIDWFDPLAVHGFSSTIVQEHQFFGIQSFLWSNSHMHIWLLGRKIALTIQTFLSRVMCLLFNILSRFFIAFLPRSKCLLISWLQSPSVVILGPKK